MNNLIWIPDKDYEWILAEIVEDNGESVVASPTTLSILKALQSGDNGVILRDIDRLSLAESTPRTSYVRSTLCEFDASHMDDLDDLCMMNNLHEAPLIHILRRRWLHDQIYTYASDVLISVNPYKVIPGLYDDPLAYFDVPDDDGDDEEEDNQQCLSDHSSLPPHAYFIANAALKRLMLASPSPTSSSSSAEKVEEDSGKIINQSVIISGESGAGKTEASKHVISFMIRANQHITSNSGKDLSNQTDRIKDVILDSSVVFEAFGNAKTVRNDNSSRFGKYIKLQYTGDNGLISAVTETFLLEKSRLVSVGNDERNYHVFYQLLRGIDAFEPSLRQTLSLTTVDDYKILTSGGCTIIRSVDEDIEEFNALYNALRNVGISHDDLDDLWKILALILHLGNASFVEPEDEGTAQINISSTTIDHLAMLLGVKTPDLLRALTTQSINIAKRSSIRSKTLTATESTNNVLALIKWLYHHIFSWLLRSINTCHGALVTASRAPVKFLGILDIFGFEILGVNSFEQLCINFTNERLQHQFNHVIFASEQEIYMNEGINWTTISYQDNQNVIDLIAKKPTGILYILEEHCMMNRTPDDMALLGQINQTHGDKATGDKIYIKSRFVKDTIFTIKHFAGGVTYRIDNFISKNNDALQDDLTELIHCSTNSFILTIINNNLNHDNNKPNTVIPKANQRKAFAAAITVSLQFRSQLDALINALRATEPHYIKCIKPNDIKSAGVFQASLTMSQLRYSGILEVVRIRREGFPIRIKFSEFYIRYEIFSRLRRNDWIRPHTCSETEAKIYCHHITSMYLPIDNYQYGNNLIFIREDGLNIMTLAVSKYASSYAVKIQAQMRRYLAKGRYHMMKICIMMLQCRLRQFISKCRLDKLKTAKRLYEEECERQRLLELARQDAERRRLEEERRKLEEERRRVEEEERQRRRREELERTKQEEALRQAIAVDEANIAHMNQTRKRLCIIISTLYRNYRLRQRLNQLHLECELGEISKKVILSDLKIRWKYRGFDTPLRTAIRHAQSKVIDNLRAMISTDKRGYHGDTLLHVASSICNEKIFHQLLHEVETRSRPPPRASIAIPPVKLDPELTISTGWMWKYRPGQRKIRRWCVLKPGKIIYFKSPEDKIPRAVVDLHIGSTLRRSNIDLYGFEIESESLPIRRNMFGAEVKKLMNFIAENEIMATDWVFHIQFRLGVPVLKRTSCSVEYHSPTILKEHICMMNHYSETLLHAIIKSPVAASSGMLEDEAIALADWLVVNGVNLVAKDASGLTIKEYAMNLGYTRWLNFLTSKERSLANQAMVDAVSADLGNTRYANIGYTYINLYIQRQVLRKGEFNDETKCMTISFKNANGELMEQPRLLRGPVLTAPHSILWSNFTKIRTPIDIITSGSVLVFEQQASGSMTVEATYVLNVKAETIQGGFVELSTISLGSQSTLTVEVMLSPY